MPERPCGRHDCPVVDPGELDRRRLHTTAWPKGTIRYRAAKLTHAGAAFTPKGLGYGRFSPLPGRAHTSVAEQRSAALLESAFHEASGPNPRIYRVQLARYALVEVRFRSDVALIDLRDPALHALGLDPVRLTDAGPLHYGCTQQVASALVGTKRTHGFLWTSRQGRLHHERNREGLASEVLHHQRLDVAVVYRPDFAGRVDVGDPSPLLAGDEPLRFVVELANLLSIAIL